MHPLLTKIGAVLAVLALSAAPVLAQTDAEMTDDAGEGTDEAILLMDNETGAEDEDLTEELASVDVTLAAVDAKEFTAENVPTGNFGLWWRSFRENMSLAFTFDATRKAEKRLLFAEERMSMAEAMLERAAADPELQEKAQAMVERAQSFMTKVGEQSERWAAKADARSERLMQNLGSHLLRREQAMDRLEEKLPEEQAERLRETREEGQGAAMRLMTALANENIPEAVREHLQGVKDRIEAHAEGVKEFRDQQKELLDRIREGDETAAEELKGLRDERRGSLMEDLDTRRQMRMERLELRDEMMEDSSSARPGVRPVIRRILNPDRTRNGVAETEAADERGAIE